MTVQTSQQFLRYSQWTKYIWKIIQGSSRTLSSAPVCYGWLSQLDYSVARLDCIILKNYIYIYVNYILYLHIPSIAILYPFKWFVVQDPFWWTFLTPGTAPFASPWWHQAPKALPPASDCPSWIPAPLVAQFWAAELTRFSWQGRYDDQWWSLNMNSYMKPSLNTMWLLPMWPPPGFCLGVRDSQSWNIIPALPLQPVSLKFHQLVVLLERRNQAANLL